ncbi:ArsR family transcriptional regulator [Sphingorhabdus sp.]|uniref:ArsR family transcriptional regulator n=1 Tax=Sphingorhabdus sp. TaxID=1902408 RepID=UPI0032B7CB0D
MAISTIAKAGRRSKPRSRSRLDQRLASGVSRSAQLDASTTVMELAAPFEMSQPAVSRHLKVLEEAGLILRWVEGAISEIDQWRDTLRQSLAANYDRLDAVLAGMKTKNRKARR